MKEQKEFMPFLDSHNWEQTVLESPKEPGLRTMLEFPGAIAPSSGYFLVCRSNFYFLSSGWSERDRQTETDGVCLSACLPACLWWVGMG